ncbi:hypothetical protein [Bradyrhizobium sp. USDA 329]|uniref:hypothetical protein n=1 Tax=unclassified Bradyrhizobium TaxID=2631580 RepID=UPI003516E853
MQLQAGHPQQKGSRRGPAYAYNIKPLRDREMLTQAEQSYERFASQWKPHRPKTGARTPQLRIPIDVAHDSEMISPTIPI